MKIACAFLLSLASIATAPAVTWEVLTFDGLNLGIPDGSYSGRADTQLVSGLVGYLAEVNVTLEIRPLAEGAFNGDLYVTLVHDTGYAVLLNRPGRRAQDPVGYLDRGISITFDDLAVYGDVHVYRETLNGSHAVGLAGALTGRWAPDGRESDPAIVLDTEPRSAGLAAFQGLNPNGTWTLFVADLIGGGTPMQLTAWGLELGVVPEPLTSTCFAGLGLAAFAAWRLRRQKGRRPLLRSTIVDSR